MSPHFLRISQVMVFLLALVQGIAGEIMLDLGSDSQRLLVQMLPNLGGKITSVKDGNGREYLSRSPRPYRARNYGLKFAEDTEFDGLDECFPTVSPCVIPSGPFKGVEIPDHGELCQIPWEVTSEMAQHSMEAQGVRLPYLFRRTILLNVIDTSVIFNYRVLNLGDQPIPYIYAFHPLFEGRDNMRLDIPDETPVLVPFSSGDFLGKPGSVMRFGDLKDGAGLPFKDNVFKKNSGRFWKFVAGPLKVGQTALHFKEGDGVALEWDRDVLPYLAVWCTEGGVMNLHHIGLEPTTGPDDDLSVAMNRGTARSLPARAAQTWSIRLRLLGQGEAAPPKPDQDVKVRRRKLSD